MTLREAANVAWHVRVIGLDGVTEENLKGAFAVLEQLAEREPLVQELTELIAGDGVGRVNPRKIIKVAEAIDNFEVDDVT